MASRTVTNTLLVLVVLCLTLIVLKMYDVHPVAKAEGGAGLPSTLIAGCHKWSSGRCVESQAIRVNEAGELVIAQTR